MRITVLDSVTLGDDIDLSPITDLGETKVYKTTPQDLVSERVRDSDVIVVNKIKLNKDNLQNAQNLKLICITATGYDNIDTLYCTSRGITVCNIPGYSTDSVVQLTVAMVLSLYCRLNEYRDFVHSGKYSESGTANCLIPVWQELSAKVWGIVGSGAIGSQVAKVAGALGCKVIVCRRNGGDTDIDTLCESADIISLHIPLTDKTRGMINKERISKMKRNAIVINTARGAVTDEGALADALLKGDIAGLGIDVYSEEPFPGTHPFSKLLDKENVILTPHTAWGSFEARTRCINEVAENIKAYFGGKTRNKVN